MKGWTAFAVSVVGIGLACAGFASTSCSSSNATGDDNGGGTDAGSTGCSSEAGTVTYSGVAGQACQAAAGQVPDPECDDAVQSGDPDGKESLCSAASPACDLSKCQVQPGTCQALTSNPTTGALNFRMRRLIVVAPPNLASQTLQNTVVTNGVDMNEPQCGEIQTGAFSWLLSIDPAAGTVKTGGAPPCDIANPTKQTPGTTSCNPFTTGYCFVNKTEGSLAIAPVTAPIHKGCDGAWATNANAIGTINIPIYYQGKIIVLPISGGAMEGVKISEDGNCIGAFNPAALATDCSDQYTNCSKWKTDGSITGYISLETADKVHVDLLNETLCVILTNSTPDKSSGYGVCQRNTDGSIKYKGDYCSTSSPPGPGGCQDSYWLAATFAASAVKINDGAGQPDCQGGGPPPADAGSDTGSTNDSGSGDAASE